MKDQVFQLRIDTATRAALDDIATGQRRTRADVIRLLVEDEQARRVRTLHELVQECVAEILADKRTPPQTTHPPNERI